MDDKIFNFEHKLEVPVLYDREDAIKTIEAIPKISQIRANRESQFIRNRILSNQEKNKEDNLKILDKLQYLTTPETASKDLRKTIKKKQCETN
jgi:hypothetical protein